MCTVHTMYVMCILSFQTTFTKRNGLIFSIIYFSRFLNVSTTDMHTLLTLLVLPPKGSGKVLLSDNPGSPLPHGLEAHLSQSLARQLFLENGEQVKVRRSYVL